MNDMTKVIIPRSDQINADDLLSGPITITITDVKVSPGQEQPVSIFFDGSDKAYRPCKSMARVLVNAWGPDASKYLGRSLTLYCDPKVKWGGMEVGGIRISHMSHIDSPMTMALTVTRANKKPFTVKPIELSKAKPAAKSAAAPASRFDDDETEATVTAEQAAELRTLCTTGGRDLSVGFKKIAGDVSDFADVLAVDYAGGKKWISKQRGLEFRGGADKPDRDITITADDVATAIQNATSADDVDQALSMLHDGIAAGDQEELRDAATSRRSELTT